MATHWVMLFIFQMMLLVSVSRARRHQEPICTSRFDYEEKLLEKMVRLEHKLELLQTMVTEQLPEIKQEKENIIGEEMNEILMKSGSTIVFSAIEANKDIVGGVATFSLVLANKGQAYNDTTGAFTSPYKGIYMFTFNIRSVNSDYCYCYIRKNGTREAYAISDGANDMGSVTVYLTLQVGDIIDLGRCSQWSNVNPKGTAFSGHLLAKL